ncbi:carbon monoxide dehydrogenase subunit G [Vineibacter terrae]|uniref:SRPBCC family protein n=1 Tax=Vineibacter terrae TaxID=2586908 RepID=UPI002E34BAD3|nr:carbon monoxide dehydrogenase subunit G [Vineibacter terrae]HEX2886036.1 carbon monoxide dehydrogenase subunit G [Vineibacter terrae]
MEFSGEYRIPASRQKVWDALNDAAVLQQCIPGCETLEKVSDTELKATVRMKIGPVSAKFGGKVTLSDMDPPNGYKITGEGQGGAAGFAKGGAVVKLTEADGATVLNYTADAQVGGKIAQIGARLIDGTARKLADEFFSKFSEVVGGEAPEAAATATDTPSTADVADPPPPAPAASAPAGSGVNGAGSPARPATDSAERGYKHWLLIGAGIALLVIAYIAIR